MFFTCKYLLHLYWKGCYSYIHVTIEILNTFSASLKEIVDRLYLYIPYNCFRVMNYRFCSDLSFGKNKITHTVELVFYSVRMCSPVHLSVSWPTSSVPSFHRSIVLCSRKWVRSNHVPYIINPIFNPWI